MEFPSTCVLRRISVASLAVLTFLLSASAATANGPEVGFDAGGLIPLESKNIQLVSEYVDVSIGGLAPVPAICYYELRNLTSEPQTILMGFILDNPVPWLHDDYALRYENAGINVSCFTFSSGHKILPSRLEKLDREKWEGVLKSPPDSIPVWEVSFGPSEDAHLTITYQTTWTPRYDYEGKTLEYANTYYARAASLWAGKIEKARIKFIFDEIEARMINCHPEIATCFEIKASPPGYKNVKKDWMSITLSSHSSLDEVHIGI